MSVSKKVQKLVVGLEVKTSQLEEKCKGLEAQNKQLTEEFVKGREEAGELKKKVMRLEQENAKLKQLLAQAQQKQKGGVGGKREDPDGVQGQGQGVQNEVGGKDPLNVFPEEVWRVIFGHLKQPETLKSLYKTCTKFMWMLQDERKNFLFLDVIKVLRDNVEGFADPTRYRAERPLLKCRLVCRAWKQSVDTFHQQTYPMFPQVSPEIYGTAYTGIEFAFASRENPWNNLELRSLSPDRNPILSRYLRYRESFTYHTPPGEKKSFQNDFLAFVRKFGGHVWYFRVELNTEMHAKSPTAWYASLLAWLKLMPNLKGLYLAVKMDYWGHSGIPKTVLNGLQKTLALNSFQTLSTLKAITLDSCHPFLMESVLNANPQLAGIKIESSSFTNYGPSTFSLHQLKLYSLQELSLNRFDFNDEFGRWQLRKLTLTAGHISWTQLFQKLQTSFAETLVELTLKLSASGHSDDARLNLSNLRVLNLKIDRCFKSIDFILPLVNLKCLKVDLTGMYQNRDKWETVNDDQYVPLPQINEMIKFHQHTHDLKNSNIWKLLPKLKKVMARTDRELGYYEDDDDDPTTPYVDDEWQYCGRNEVDI